jgi:5'-nucleotidase
MKKSRILITNDDGIHAQGIKHLWKALKDHADLTIIAPAAEQSSVGLSVTLRSPLQIEKLNWPGETPAWSVSGTPADCIKMALKVILESKPDLVVSGINRGTNSGRNILYSGTVCGTIEAVLQDIPGVAFSCYDYEEPSYSEAEQFIPKIVKYIQDYPLPSGTLLNVNFPSKIHGPIKGIKMTRQGKSYWAENPDKRIHPTEGNSYYWLGSKYREYAEDSDGDIHTLNSGFAAAVPVHVAELTDHHHLKEHRSRFEKFFL